MLSSRKQFKNYKRYFFRKHNANDENTANKTLPGTQQTRDKSSGYAHKITMFFNRLHFKTVMFAKSNSITFYAVWRRSKRLFSLDPSLFGLDGAGICQNNEKVWITQMYLYDANLSKYIMHLSFTLMK